MFPVSAIARRMRASALVDATGITTGFAPTRTLATTTPVRRRNGARAAVAIGANIEPRIQRIASNRSMQRMRNARRSFEPIANMDVIGFRQPLRSDFYILCDADEVGTAKMNAWTVHIAVLSALLAPLT